MLQENFRNSLKGVSRVFQWNFVLQVCCCMDFIAATQAEGGLVCSVKGLKNEFFRQNEKFLCVLGEGVKIWHILTKIWHLLTGGRGVQNGLKNADVINERPLIECWAAPIKQTQIRELCFSLLDYSWQPKHSSLQTSLRREWWLHRPPCVNKSYVQYEIIKEIINLYL